VSTPADSNSESSDTDSTDFDINLAPVPIFADMFQPGNIDGPTMERWQVTGSCTTTADNSGINLGVSCRGDSTISQIQTSFSTVGYTNINVSYGRLPNNKAAFEEDERFLAQWSADGDEPWFDIEESTSEEWEVKSYNLPETAEDNPALALRFRVEADGSDGNELFWLDTVVVSGDVPQCENHNWKEQFDAPFTDDNGEFVGGSEIFRIAPHNGEL